MNKYYVRGGRLGFVDDRKSNVTDRLKVGHAYNELLTLSTSMMRFKKRRPSHVDRPPDCQRSVQNSSFARSSFKFLRLVELLSFASLVPASRGILSCELWCRSRSVGSMPLPPMLRMANSNWYYCGYGSENSNNPYPG
jgi:hypothetical protein